MAFVVETGIGLQTANSYVTVTEADAYHTLYRNEDWATDGTVTNADKELALLHATKACDLLFGNQFQSMPATTTQSLLFPRFTFVINKGQIVQSNQIPQQLKDAVCELALKQLTGIDIYPTNNIMGQYQSDSLKLGDLTISASYKSSPKVEQFDGFWKIEMLLTPLLIKGGLCNNASVMGL